MHAAPSIGVVFPARSRIELLPGFATRADRAGFDELWVVEDCFLSGGISMAATALALTRRLRVGIGLLPVVARNPVIAAMEVGSLARLHPGRLSIAFGHGVADWMRQIGAYPRSRLAALEEVTTVVRSLLGGETTSLDGEHVQVVDAYLEASPDPPPSILVGSTGPRGLAIAGRSSDGVLLAEGASAPFIEWAVRQTRAAGDRRGPFRCVVYSWARLDDDEQRALAWLRAAVDSWRSSALYPEPTRLAPPEIRELGVAGTPTGCAAAVRRLAQAGATSVVLAPLGDDIEAQVDRLGAELLPLIRAATPVAP
jgi:alkanesulfonate monooxygenase SsuD/methylene tetrahydromethanopterin reductase-like flavin-dependent oxidoreductase (luciferase family)